MSAKRTKTAATEVYAQAPGTHGGKRPGAGAKPALSTGARAARMELRLHADERAAMDQAAARAHLATSDWARSVLLREAINNVRKGR